LRTQQPAKGLATEREALALDKCLAEVVIVEAGVGAACQPHDALPHSIRQAAVAGSPAIGVKPKPPPRLRAYASSSA
jgi:hypothetical protein